MVWVFLTVVAVLLVAVVGALLAGRIRWDPMSEPVRTRPGTGLPSEPDADDVVGVRFDTAARGYRMDQVDDVLDALRDRIAGQQAEIDRLRAAGAPGVADVAVHEHAEHAEHGDAGTHASVDAGTDADTDEAGGH